MIARSLLTRMGVAAVAGAFLLTGCSFEGAQEFTLPGGVATGADAYEIKVEFSNVLDLVPQSAVKVNGVTVGSVAEIELKNERTALVTVQVLDEVRLPANSTASVSQTSLLGEKYVSLKPPPPGKAVSTQLRDMQPEPYIPLERTTRNAEVEQVLSALSLVLNGGGLEQVQTISKEITNILQGREPEIKDLLDELDQFVGGLDQQKADIVRALDSLDRLTARLADQRVIIATALQDLPGGARILADQRANLTQLVKGLDRLGNVAVRVIKASQQNTVADLKALQPVLAGLNSAGKSLPRALELLTTYPFPREVASGIRGDYANLFISLDLSSLLVNPLPALPGPLRQIASSGAPTTPRSAPSTGRPDGPSRPADPSRPTGPTRPDGPALELPAIPGLTGPQASSTITSLTRLLLGGLLSGPGER